MPGLSSTRVLGVILLFTGLALVLATPVAAALLAIQSWGDKVVKVGTYYVFVGRKMVYYNDDVTARQILPRIVIPEANLDTGKRLAWVVNPGQTYSCTPGWSIAREYEGRTVHVKIEIYTARAPQLTDEKLEGVTEFTVTIPEKQPPPRKPRITVDGYECKAEAGGGEYFVYGTLYLKNTGDGSGLAEVYFLVDGKKIPGGDQVYRTPTLAPGEVYALKFGRWSWSRGPIEAHVYTKVNPSDAPLYNEKIDITPEEAPPSGDGGDAWEGETPPATPVEDGELEELPYNRDLVVSSGFASAILGVALLAKDEW